MSNDNFNQVSSILQALKTTLDDFQSKSLYILQLDINSTTINSLLELKNRALVIFSPQDPIFSNLSHLITLVNKLKDYQSYSPKSFIQRCLISHQIYGVVLLIQKEIQLCFDRVNIENIVVVLQGSREEEEKLRVLEQFKDCISSGFKRELQDMILKARLFQVLESILCDNSCTPSVRGNAASAIASLARFNRNVFVGYVLMGVTIPTLVLMSTSESLQILTSLMKFIGGHLVDMMELNGEIPRIIGLLSSENTQVKLMAIDCLLEMVYYSRKEVIEGMIDCGLVEKLVFLQRVQEFDQVENTASCVELEDNFLMENGGFSTNNPFSGCVAKLAVHVEVGQWMEKEDKKEIKMKILKRVREASISEAEAATVVAEVLWGSHL